MSSMAMPREGAVEDLFDPPCEALVLRRIKIDGSQIKHQSLSGPLLRSHAFYQLQILVALAGSAVALSHLSDEHIEIIPWLGESVKY